MSRVKTVVRDLVALGPMAPLRAVYEVSKRSGAHGRLLRKAVSGARVRPLHVLPAMLPKGAVSDTVRARTLADAELIRTEGHRVFGHRIPISSSDDWAQLPLTNRTWPTATYWWNIDIRTEARLGDVKWTWELGRHRDLVVLARAIHLDPGDQWEHELNQRLRWWFEATPAEVGIHWYSNLEIALRIIAWTQIYALASTALEADVRESLALHVAQAERHLLADFAYTATSMRNNHLLGDSLGLIAIDRFRGGDGTRRSARLAERCFHGQLRRHMRSDGSMIEDSLSYHRFVLEMLAVKHLLGDRAPETILALRGAANHLLRLGALQGSLPAWGDWDEGRILTSSGNALDVGGSAALGIALADGICLHTARDLEEVAWYAPTSRETRNHDFPRVATSGGISLVRHSDWEVWFKHGTGPSHQHADLTHVSIKWRGNWIIVDPGTGTYNGDLEIRNAFRTDVAHNGLRLAGEEMFVPHRAFRWLSGADCAGSAALTVGDRTILAGLHNAYSRDGLARRIARVLVIDRGSVLCFDCLESPASASITIALAPGIVLPEPHRGKALLAVSGQELGIEVPGDVRIAHGRKDPVQGWYSETYGHQTPTSWLISDLPQSGIHIWALGTTDSSRVERTRNGAALTIGLTSIKISFNTSGAALVVTDEGRLFDLRVDGVPA